MESVKNIRERKQEEKLNQPSSLSISESDYVDKLGKLWSFHANIGKNISHDKLLKKFDFSTIRYNGKTTLNLKCQKNNPTGGKCPFAGIYLKTNGCLYTQGQHEHTKRGKTPKNVGEDYVDQNSKIWKFSKEIGTNIQKEMLHKMFDFTTIVTKESGLYLRCETQRNNVRCKFAGVYLNSNGCLYTRGNHNHEQIQQHKNPNVGGDYVDVYGKVWPFHVKIGKKHIPNGIFRNKFGFSSIQQKQKTLNLYCHKRITNGERCPIKGIYVKENGCLYIRGKHEH